MGEICIKAGFRVVVRIFIGLIKLKVNTALYGEENLKSNRGNVYKGCCYYLGLAWHNTHEYRGEIPMNYSFNISFTSKTCVYWLLG